MGQSIVFLFGEESKRNFYSGKYKLYAFLLFSSSTGKIFKIVTFLFITTPTPSGYRPIYMKTNVSPLLCVPHRPVFAIMICFAYLFSYELSIFLNNIKRLFTLPVVGFIGLFFDRFLIIYTYKPFGFKAPPPVNRSTQNPLRSCISPGHVTGILPGML